LRQHATGQVGILEDDLGPIGEGQQLLRTVTAEQEVEVFRRGEKDVGTFEGLTEGSPRDIQIGPASGAEIRIEGHAPAFGPRVAEHVEQPLASTFSVQGKGNAREIDEIVSADGFDDVLSLRRLEQQARGSGLGRALAEAALARARERGCARVELDVNAANQAALALYESLGFESWSDPPGGRNLLMRRRL